jgi:hypothetical protein
MPGAIRTAGLVQKPDDRGDAQRGVADAQAKAGDIAGALTTTELIQARDARAAILPCLHPGRTPQSAPRFGHRSRTGGPSRAAGPWLVEYGPSSAREGKFR